MSMEIPCQCRMLGASTPAVTPCLVPLVSLHVGSTCKALARLAGGVTTTLVGVGGICASLALGATGGPTTHLVLIGAVSALG